VRVKYLRAPQVAEWIVEVVQEAQHTAMPGHITWHCRFHQHCRGPLGSGPGGCAQVGNGLWH
jgi:hypothetical protein